MNSFFGACFAVVFTALLCIFPQISISAAYNALILCGKIIIPSLFPFFVFSALIISSGAVKPLCRALGHVMRPLFGMRGICAVPVVLGLLSGYPMGAHLTACLYKSGDISKREASSLLSFANNSGPLFIIGAVGVGIFGNLYTGYYLYAIHALSAIITGILLRFFVKSENLPENAAAYGGDGASLPDAVKSSVLSVLNLCGFIIFFSVVLKLSERAGITGLMSLALSRAGLSGDTAALISGGIFEITTALSSCRGAALPAVSMIISLGGMSVLLQTAGCTHDAHLSVSPYINGKLICAVVSLLLCHFTLPFFPAAVPVLARHEPIALKLRLFTFYILATAFVCIVLLGIATVSELVERNKSKKKVPRGTKKKR